MDIVQENEKVTQTLFRKHTAEEWMREENLAVLTGLAMQSSTIKELARRIGETTKTLISWREAHPKIEAATNFGRADADAWVVAQTFTALRGGSHAAATRWWRFRLSDRPDRPKPTGGRAKVVILNSRLDRA